MKTFAFSVSLALLALAACQSVDTAHNGFASPTPKGEPSATPAPAFLPPQPPIVHALRSADAWKEIEPGIYQLTNFVFEGGEKPPFQYSKFRVFLSGRKNGEYYVALTSSPVPGGVGDVFLCRHVAEKDTWQVIGSNLRKEYSDYFRSSPKKTFSEYFSEKHGLDVVGDMISRDGTLRPNRTNITKIDNGMEDGLFADTTFLLNFPFARTDENVLLGPSMTGVSIGTASFLLTHLWQSGSDKNEPDWLALFALPIEKGGTLATWKDLRAKTVRVPRSSHEGFQQIFSEKEQSVFLLEIGDIWHLYSVAEGAFPVNW